MDVTKMMRKHNECTNIEHSPVPKKIYIWETENGFFCLELIIHYLSSPQIIQEFNQQLFMQENPVFHKAHDFQFQPSEYDTVRNTVQTSSLLRVNRQYSANVGFNLTSLVLGLHTLPMNQFPQQQDCSIFPLYAHINT